MSRKIRGRVICIGGTRRSGRLQSAARSRRARCRQAHRSAYHQRVEDQPPLARPLVPVELPPVLVQRAAPLAGLVFPLGLPEQGVEAGPVVLPAPAVVVPYHDLPAEVREERRYRRRPVKQGLHVVS